MKVLRTPDERFAGLAAWPYAPRYVDVDGVRVHYVDEGPPDATPLLLVHGEPSWGYLYRKMIPVLTGAGHRVIVPDLVGFGRSDKPAAVDDYTYRRHIGWMRAVVEHLDLRGITLFGQDWGGLIGLRLLVEDAESGAGRFARVVAGNTGLPTGNPPMPEPWHAFRRWIEEAEDLPIGWLVSKGCATELDEATIAAYDAPFPDPSFKAGARAFPALVPYHPEHPDAADNERAWKVLEELDLPFLTVFGDRDPITAGADRLFQARVPGCGGQPHATIEGAAHYLQEDAGGQVAQVIVDWLDGGA